MHIYNNLVVLLALLALDFVALRLLSVLPHDDPAPVVEMDGLAPELLAHNSRGVARGEDDAVGGREHRDAGGKKGLEGEEDEECRVGAGGCRSVMERDAVPWVLDTKGPAPKGETH